MNINAEAHFSNLPSIDIRRSKFKRNFSHKTTFNEGELIPISCDHVLPGDTVKIRLSSVTRMTTPIVPVMDNAVQDVFAFFVPERLLWSHFKEYWGENNTTHWEQPVEYEKPQIAAPSGGWNEGSLADYFGIPTKVDGFEVNHLPFRAYCKCVNDYFRDQNLKDPCDMNLDETTLTGVNKGLSYDYVTDTQLGAAPFRVARLHDMFSSCLPEPLKGPDVFVPIGSSAPVFAMGSDYDFADLPKDSDSGYAYPIHFSTINGNKNKGFLHTSEAGNLFTDAQNNPGDTLSQTPINLAADLSNAIGATISQLRQSFALQRFYEAQARCGSRYNETLAGIFGVKSADARLQRAEFVGGKRIPINMDQVLQTSATGASGTPQGNTAAFSCTAQSDELLTYSAQEHGYLLVVTCVRVEHTYQQGIEPMWFRKKRIEEYVPQFANLSEMPLFNKQIYLQGSDDDDEVFGYNEAWVDYRVKNSYVTGKMRSNATQSLDIWHYADDYNSLPTLSGEWIDEGDENISRTLAVKDQPQFFADFFFDATWVRPLPLYSVPGLLDHH